MNKQLVAAALSLAVGTLGCGGSKSETKEDKGMRPADCNYPDSPKDAAPMWVCTEHVEGVSISAVGIAPPQAAGVDFQVTMAEADGRSKLARQFRIRVQDMTKKYLGTTGVGDAQTVDAAAESVTKQVSDEMLVGSRQFIKNTSPGGTLYVLMGMDGTMAKEASKQAVNTSMNNDQALWQQFKAKMSQDELAEEVGKLMESAGRVPTGAAPGSK